LFFTILIYSNVIAQKKTVPDNKKLIKTECGSDEIHKKLMATDSVYRKKNEDFEKLMAAVNSSKTINGQLPVYTMPVVFRLMDPGNAAGTGVNLTDQQINGGLRYINRKLRENPVKYNDSLGVVLQLELASADTNKAQNTSIMRYNMKKETNYVKSGVALGKLKGVSIEKVKALGRPLVNNSLTIYLVNKINEQDCSNKSDDLIAGYSHFYSSRNTFAAEIFVLGCSFSNINNDTVLSSELINSLNLYYITKKNNSNKKCYSKMNYELFYSNTCK